MSSKYDYEFSELESESGLKGGQGRSGAELDEKTDAIMLALIAFTAAVVVVAMVVVACFL